jgi:hypothetical protein
MRGQVLNLLINNIYLLFINKFNTFAVVVPSFLLPVMRPLPTPASPIFDRPNVRRTAGVLMYLGIMELGLWLAYCCQNFYWGSRTILLSVHAGLKLGASHPHLGTMLASPVGYYSTGTQGDLLYHASSLGDYLLFYSVGDLTSLDALFLAGLGVYLHWSVRRLPSGQEFTPAASRAIGVIALATMAMFVGKMAFNIAAGQVFQAKTQHLFTLATKSGSGSILYVVFGLLLAFCAEFFQRGQQLQQETELTI